MNSVANSAFILEVAELVLFIACGYLAFMTWARYARSAWVLELATRRLTLLLLLTVSVVGIKIFEDVIARESSPVDQAILWFIRQNLPPALSGFFEAVTWTGAAIFLVPVSAVVCCLLLLKRYRREAAFLAVSMLSGWAFTNIVKSVVSRARPDLWSSTWYWGSSFPSGHTLSTAAFSTALTLIAARIWPVSRRVVWLLAVLWTGLMAMSRMVLGVHWPTDVLAAICVGVFLPLVFHLFLFRAGPDLQASRLNKIEA